MPPETHIPLAELGHYVARSPAEMVARAEAFGAEIARRHSIRAFAPDPVPRAVIEAAIRAAATAPNGANRQPWFFAAVADPGVKRTIRREAEAEERAFYAERAGEDWLAALAPLGTDADKPFLEIAPWLIVIFAERKGADGGKNYYVAESVGIATGILITALHTAGLATLTHTPAPMAFLNAILGRPETEKPYLILVVGHPAADATVPAHALAKKPFEAVAGFW